MHSFHQSRGRIFFDVLCALTIAASCAVAWIQTGASALLAMAGVALLYSVVRTSDLGGRNNAAVVVGRPDSVPAMEESAELLTDAAAVVAEEPKAAKPKRRTRKKAVEAVVEVSPPEPDPIAEAPAVEELEEDYHAPVTPLFEPQPLVRQQRAVFGRKA